MLYEGDVYAAPLWEPCQNILVWAICLVCLGNFTNKKYLSVPTFYKIETYAAEAAIWKPAFGTLKFWEETLSLLRTKGLVRQAKGTIVLSAWITLVTLLMAGIQQPFGGIFLLGVCFWGCFCDFALIFLFKIDPKMNHAPWTLNTYSPMLPLDRCLRISGGSCHWSCFG